MPTRRHCLGGLLILAALAAAPADAVAGVTLRLVDTARLTLGTLVPDAPKDVRDVDLGPAPPAGATRAFSGRQLRDKLRELGVDPKRVDVPDVLRVKSAVKTFKPVELEALVTPAIERGLRRGIELKTVTPRRALKLAPRVAVGDVTVPRPPRRRGQHRVTASVALSLDGEIVRRITVPVTVTVTEEGLKRDVPRGARVNLVVERGAARITAAATALSDADIGDTVMFRVIRTRKTLRARVVSRSTARVVEQ